MTSSISKVPLFRWELKDFYSQFRNNTNKDIISENFNVGSFSFALFYKPVSLWDSDKFGVILKDLAGKQSVEVSLKLWFENEQDQMFQENSIEKHVFNKMDDRCGFNLKSSGNDYQLISNVYTNKKTLYICCKFADLNYQTTVPITGCTQFHENTWSMYEQGLHDSIIKVGNMEFKILKSQFIAQSEVFKNMFNLNFKERETSIVVVKDVSEQTMKQLIKWMYTCQIEDKNAVEELFKTADKYQIHLLKTNCAELMINSLDNSNVFRRLILAIMYNNNQLKDFALIYISNVPIMEAAAYFTSSEWVELVQKKPVFAKEVNKLINDKLEK